MSGWQPSQAFRQATDCQYAKTLGLHQKGVNLQTPLPCAVSEDCTQSEEQQIL